MENFKNINLFVASMFVMLTSCNSDEGYVQVPNESLLESRIVELYGSKEALILPLSEEFDLIPSDVNNPITESES